MNRNVCRLRAFVPLTLLLASGFAGFPAYAQQEPGAGRG